MKYLTIVLLLIVVLTFVHTKTVGEVKEDVKAKANEATDKVKEKVHNAGEAIKDKLKLNPDNKDLPEQAGKTAEAAREGVEHIANVVEDVASIPSDSLKDKIHDAVDAVKEAVKGATKTVETVKDAHGVPVDAGKDAAKEGIHVATMKEGKVEDVKEFVKEEVVETKEKVAEGLQVNNPDSKIKDVIDSAKQGINQAKEAIKEKLHKDGGEKAEEKKAEGEKVEGEQAEGAEPNLVDQLKGHFYRFADAIKQTIERFGGDNATTAPAANTSQNDDEEL